MGTLGRVLVLGACALLTGCFPGEAQTAPLEEADVGLAGDTPELAG